MNSINKQIAIVTGASAGLGAEFARQLVSKGYGLLLIARRLDRLQLLADELKAEFGVAAKARPCDLADPAALEILCSEIESRNDVSILVNNAGFGVPGKLTYADGEQLEKQTIAHVLAPMKLARAVLPGMIEKRHGAIVNVSSVAAFVPAPGTVNYHATKAYEAAFSEALALELKGTGVYVQALCPGFTHTEFHAVSGFDKKQVPMRWWLNADFVVRTSLREVSRRDARGMPRGRTIVVPGWGYRLAVNMLNTLPRPLVWAASRFRPTSK
ncbi:MAG: SDR family oxidoreductase [bacterium]|jgi:hypothetical protein